MMVEEIKLLGQFGVGAVLAGVVFWYYRQDRKDSESRYEKLGLDFRAIVQSNTEAISSLRDTLKSRENENDLRREFERFRDKVRTDMTNMTGSIARHHAREGG